MAAHTCITCALYTCALGAALTKNIVMNAISEDRLKGILFNLGIICHDKPISVCLAKVKFTVTSQNVI